MIGRILVLFLWIALPFWGQILAQDSPAPPAEVSVTSLARDKLVIPVPVAPGSNIGEALRAWPIPTAEVREAARPLYDLALVNPTHELSLVLADGEPAPIGLRYALEEGSYLLVERGGDGWNARVTAAEWTSTLTPFALEIRASLWAAGLEAGLRPGDLVRLARLFEYDVDFNTEIREGAKLALIAEVLHADGFEPKLGTIFASRLINAGLTYEAVRFPDASGRERYFHPDGTGVARAFLRSPLAFNRVTSAFNPHRFHPILKTARPHNGTDLGAPIGTPVRVVANGVVTFAGNGGGHGNYIKVQHSFGIETSYSHLSRILVRKGQRVSLGQEIGRVGMTGLATGPHLHYQMWKNGRYVDALREKLPTGEPVPASEKAAFDAQVAEWLAQVPPTP